MSLGSYRMVAHLYAYEIRAKIACIGHFDANWLNGCESMWKRFDCIRRLLECPASTKLVKIQRNIMWHVRKSMHRKGAVPGNQTWKTCISDLHFSVLQFAQHGKVRHTQVTNSGVRVWRFLPASCEMSDCLRKEGNLPNMSGMPEDRIGSMLLPR
jgi:hypothetical protein